MHRLPALIVLLFLALLLAASCSAQVLNKL